MKLINNRYKVIEQLEEGEDLSVYLCADLWNEDLLIRVNILQKNIMSDKLKKFYIEEFIGLNSLDYKGIIKNSNFDRVSAIDNTKNIDEQYLYTCEYIDNPIPILDYIKDKSTFEIIDISLEIFRALHYVHLNSYAYGGLNIRDISVIETKEGYGIKLKDLASVKLQAVLSGQGDLEGEGEDESHEIFKAEGLSLSDRRMDMHSLGRIFINMISKGDCKFLEIDIIEAFKESIERDMFGNLNDEEKNFILKVLPVLKKLLSLEKEYPYRYITDYIADINLAAGTDYSVVPIESLEKLNIYNKLVGRESLIEDIEESYEHMMDYKGNKNIFLIEGSSGVGKTRFLKEIDFLLKMKGANVYSNYKLNDIDDDVDVLEGIFNSMILNWDKLAAGMGKTELDRMMTGEIDFKSAGFEESFNDPAKRDKLLNKMSKFILDILRLQPGVIIIDNINLAGDFTIDIIKYIYSEIIKEKNIILIFSYKREKLEENKNNLDFIKRLKDSNETSTRQLENLNLQETGLMIKNILSMNHVPLVLSQRVYEKSYGNPLFVSEIVKELYSSKRLYRQEDNGLWYIDIKKEDTDYKGLAIPDNLEEALLNQLEDITQREQLIIDAISLAFNPIGLADLEELLSIKREDLEAALAELNNRGILSIAFRNHEEVYEINNRVLSDIIYEKIPEDIKIDTHKLAAEVLIERIKKHVKVNLDELIYHLEKSLDVKRARRYLIQSTKEKYSVKNIKGAVEDLDRAVSYMGEENISQKINLLFKKIDMCLEIEWIDRAQASIEMIEKLNKTQRDLKISLKINILKGEIHLLTGNFKMMEHYIKIASHLFKETDDLEFRLRFNILETVMLFNANRLQECRDLCKEIINRAGKAYIKPKADAYRMMGRVYIRLNKFEEAIECNEKSIKLLETIGYTRGIVYALNNIGIIYHSNYQNDERALEYYEKILKISQKGEIVSGELMSLSNMGALFYESYNYDKAYYYFKKSLKLALEVNYKLDVFFLYIQLTVLCLDKGDYSKACEYYKLSLKLSKNNQMFSDELKMVKGEVYYNLGAFYDSLFWMGEGLDQVKGEITSINYKYSIRYYALKIVAEELEESEIDGYVDMIIEKSRKLDMPQVRITELSKASEMLYRKGDRENAVKIFQEMESSIDEKIDQEGRGYYHYTKGLLNEGQRSIDSLKTALKLAKRNSNKLLIANTKIEIGNYYYEGKDYYWAVDYYIGAAEIMRTLIDEVPDKYKLDFVNNYYYIRFFYRLRELLEMFLQNKGEELVLKEEKDSYKIESLDELSELMDRDYNILANNKRFIDAYRKNALGPIKGEAFQERNIMEELDEDVSGNLEKLLEYLADITLASKAEIIIEEEKELTAAASIGSETKGETSRYAFERLKTSMEPIVVSSKRILNEYDRGLLRGSLKAAMYIPIVNGYASWYKQHDKEIYKKDYKLLGYIYLETKNIINNFSEEVLRENIGLVNLTAILCEKYKLARIANIDKLTGALTRKHLDEDLKELVKSTKANGQEFSIIMYDLDRFKRVNDKFGHQTGDQVLKKVSQIVMDNIDKTSSLVRYGGEEFVVILPDTGSEEALKITDRLREAISGAKILGDLSAVCISGGVASYPLHANTADQLIERADQALYSAKENGRNRSEVWNKNIGNKRKPINKLDGIVTGDDVSDARNVLAIVEMMELMNSDLTKKERIDSYLARLIETIDAELGYLLLVEEGEIVETHKKKTIRKEKLVKNSFYNEAIVENVIKTQEGIYTIDWNDSRKTSKVAGLQVWSSILAVPIMRKGILKGLIYMIVASSIKEFGADDFNFANIYSNLFTL